MNNSNDSKANIDILDELIINFRPIEQLFKVMSATDASIGGDLVRQYAEIGLCLTAIFRIHLTKNFTSNGENMDDKIECNHNS